MSNKPKCCLCGSSVEDPINLGDMKHCKGYNAHYYCLLLASTIKQSGDDDEGILGFLPEDIAAELKRSKTRICSYCKKSGASVLCNTKHCKIVFHLPCGIEHDSEHQFYGRFLSNCVTHRPKQKYTKPKEAQNCPICFEVLNFKNWTKILWTPCCKKKSYFHKLCLKQMALSAGYFCRCPICNNVDIFQKTMKNYGVFIPDRDASWELEPNAYEDLLHRHEECNAEVCVCPRGNTYTNITTWMIVLCAACGSQGTHLPCSKLKPTDTWICAVCNNASSSSPQPGSSTSTVNSSSLDFINNQASSSSVTFSAPSTSSDTSEDYSGPSGTRKRRRSSDSSEIVKREKMSSPIEIDSDSDVVVIEEDEPGHKCVLGQDGQLLPVHSISSPKPFSVQGDLNISENEKESDGLMNIIISDVRSLNTSSPNIKETPNQSPIEKQRIQALNGPRQNSEKHYVLCTPAGNERNAKNSVSIIHNQGNVYILKEFIEYHQVLQNNRIIEDQNNQNAGNYNSQDSEIVVID